MIRRCAACGQDNNVPARHLASAGRCGACKAPLDPLARPLEADEPTFEDVTRNARVPVLVDFWAAWCGPCRMVEPELVKAAKALSGRGVVLRVDTDRYPALAARHGVSGIPNFVVFSGGRKVFQQAGAVNHRTLESWVERAAGA